MKPGQTRPQHLSRPTALLVFDPEKADFTAITVMHPRDSYGATTINLFKTEIYKDRHRLLATEPTEN